jgi:two-component system, cell cycle sensor histidine kinase and response regulator CckA
MKPLIMIVEDESIVARDIQKTLEFLGYEVLSIENSGENALKRIEERPPDLILMDIVLKGQIDGIETARLINARSTIPVVFLTSYADDKVLEEAKKTAPFGYIIKPYDERELKTTIEMVLYKAKMENKLREREEWLHTTLKSIGDGVITTDGQGLITFINPVAQFLSGFNHEDALGKPLSEIIRIIDQKADEIIESPISKVLKDGSIVFPTSQRILKTFAGREIPIDYKSAPIKDNRGNIIGAVLIFQDITERKRTEEELLKVQKLESIGILAGGIAHEFNNILTAILGNITLIKMYAKTSDEIHESLIEAEKASLRAKELSQQLLVFSKGGSPVKETASLGELVKDVSEFAAKGSTIRCKYEITDDLWPVEIDKSQISQVINNIILNAVQAMEQGGIVSVKVENSEIAKDDTPSLREGRYVKMTVADQGIGIAEQNLSRIFDPYFSTKQTGKGMGLAIAYSIIRKHGGQISVQSQQDKGTSVSIYLPSTADAKIDSGPRDEALHLGKGKILVMDDEISIRSSLKRMLAYLGYEISFASDGKEALEIFAREKESGKGFDALILDLTVPGGMGGKETITRLRALDGEVKAIASSGYSDDPVMAEFASHGFAGYLTKPYSLKELSTTLHETIGAREIRAHYE